MILALRAEDYYKLLKEFVMTKEVISKDVLTHIVRRYYNESDIKLEFKLDWKYAGGDVEGHVPPMEYQEIGDIILTRPSNQKEPS